MTRSSNLDEDVEQSQRKNDDSGDGRGHEHDDADLQQLEDVSQHHLKGLGDHAVDGVDLLGEAVEEVSARRALEERHGRAQDAMQKVQVKMARSDDASQRDGYGGGKDGDPWNKHREAV